jgi:hypothetical protein
MKTDIPGSRVGVYTSFWNIALRSHVVDRRFRDAYCLRHQGNQLNVVVEWLTGLVRFREVPDSKFGPETGYPDRRCCGFPQYLQANFDIVA